MDIFLSLVQLLEQNNLVQSTEQMAKIMNNGVPSFTDHQLSPLPIAVGIAERLQRLQMLGLDRIRRLD